MIKFEPKDGYEKLAFGVMIEPNRPNVYGDFHTKESVRQFAYGFMLNGFGIDIDHDNVNVSSRVKIVESFIAQANDPRGFPEGAWIIGIHVLDDIIWDDILSGELTGFSYEAMVSVLGVTVNVEDVRELTGETFPAEDGHTHRWWARLDEDGRVIAGGTTVDQGHSHSIRTASRTELDENETHRHRVSIQNANEVTADAA